MAGVLIRKGDEDIGAHRGMTMWSRLQPDISQGEPFQRKPTLPTP